MPTLPDSRHERLVQAIAKGEAAGDAMKHAGIVLHECINPERSYVYLLTDSRDGSVFYIGKGTGKRFSVHETDARNGRIGNPAKHDRIADIRRTGGRAVALCLHDGMSPGDALDLERTMIGLVGFSLLTNILPGEMSARKRSSRLAKSKLRSIKDFADWCAERPRMEAEKSLFRLVVAGFQHIAEHGQITEATATLHGLEVA